MTNKDAGEIIWSFLAAAVLLWGAAGWSQVTTGTILGSVKDQSGAVLPGATVTATDVDTGIARSDVTDSRGEYRIPALALGNYSVAATMSGFEALTRTGITLTVGRNAVVDFTLSVGTVTQNVTVTAEAPLIDTTTADVSGLVAPQQVHDLPLNNRDLIELVPLEAGAEFSETGGTSAIQGFATKISIAGTRFNGNLFLLDGTDIDDSGGSAGSAAGILMGVETVREFNVITDAYDAEYGYHVGGVISAVTKSGTNQFHGSLFDYLRNQDLDAPSFNENYEDNGVKSPFRRNQFGGTIGGPIKKDSLFFFGSFEGLRLTTSTTTPEAMPGPLIRQGCDPVTSGSGLTQVRTAVDCYQANGTVTQYTPANDPIWPNLPAYGVVSPNVAPFMNAYPLGNLPSTAIASYNGQNPDGTIDRAVTDTDTTSENYWLTRLDKTFSDKDSLFFRYNNDTALLFSPEFDVASYTGTGNHYATLGETHIFSPSLLATSTFSFTRSNIGIYNETLESLGLASYALPVLSFANNSFPGLLSITGLEGWGSGSSEALGIPKDDIQNTFQYKEGFNWTNGRHALKFGAEINHQQFNQFSTNAAMGDYSFPSIPAFIQGDVSSFEASAPGYNPYRSWRQSLFGLYVQDNISVRPGLTLNVGLRYEPETVLSEVNGLSSSLMGLTPAQLATESPSSIVVGPLYQNPSLLNLAPRGGLVWAPQGLGGKTSIRAGAGVFYVDVQDSEIITSGALAYPFYVNTTLTSASFLQQTGENIAFPYAYTQQANVLVSGGGAPLPEGMQYNISQPTVYKYSFSIQQQLTNDSTLEVGYSGSHSIHLFRYVVLDTTPLENIPSLGGAQAIAIEQPLQNPSFSGLEWRLTDGSAKYNALLATYTKRFSHGFQLQSSFTWSSALDDGSRFGATGDFSNDLQPNQSEHMWGPSSFDEPLNWTTNFSYNLPFTFQNHVLNKILGGWNVTGIFHMNSGDPLSLTSSFPTLYTLNGKLTGDNGLSSCSGETGCTTYTVLNLAGQEVNMNGVGSIPVTPGAVSPGQYFSIANIAPLQSFANNTVLQDVPGAGVNGAPGPVLLVGNDGRNIIWGPGLINLDATLEKTTPVPMLGEAGRLVFRIEFYNVTNTTRLNNPGTAIFNALGEVESTAGVIQGMYPSSNPRQMQLALRLEF